MEVFSFFQNRPVLRNYLLIIFTGSTLGIAVLYYLTFSEGISNTTAKAYAFAAFIGVLSGIVIHIISKFLDKTITWHTQAGYRLMVGIMLNSIVAYLIVHFGIKLYSAFNELSFNEEVVYFFKIKLVILLVILIVLYCVLYFSYYSYNYYHHTQISSLKLERKQIDLQLDALKSQLSPHFLFNNLNTISALHFNEPEKAVGFIRKMGECYQYTLDSYDKVLVPVSEELALVDSYYHLLQTRFENQLKVNINVDDLHKGKYVPALSIQMLVENVIKHNKIVKDELLVVDINSVANTIEVRNNITSNPASVDSFKVGLNNIDKRYKLITGNGIAYEQGTNFIVTLPLIDE